MSRIVVVASHRRSGTHQMLDTLRANVRGVSRRFMNLDRIEPDHPDHLPLAEFDRRLRSHRGIVLVKTHALPDVRYWQSREAGEYAIALLSGSPIVYAHRDGRDVLVSLYHYMASYSPAIAATPFGDFIRARQSAPDAPSLSRPAFWAHHVLTWLRSKPRALGDFTAMQADFEPTLRTLAESLDLPLKPTLRRIALDADEGWILAARRTIGQLLRGRRAARRSTAIRPRNGTTGGWREAFEADDLAFYDAEAAEGMRALGYR